jgi:hypothetical protein
MVPDTEVVKTSRTVGIFNRSTVPLTNMAKNTQRPGPIIVRNPQDKARKNMGHECFQAHHHILGQIGRRVSITESGSTPVCTPSPALDLLR